MNQSPASFQPTYAVEASQASLVRSVFSWMTAGLLLTGVVSYFVLSSPSFLMTLVQTPGLLIGLFIAEVALVVWLSARVQKMSAAKATNIFMLYSGLNGVTIAPLVAIYTGESVVSAFLITGLLFGSMAFYGYVTKRDLSGMGSFLMMGLIGIIIASVVNMFLQSQMTSFIVSVIAVIVFTGLTAWDMQRIKSMAQGVTEGTDGFRRMAIIGALSLYLNVINLFIHILQFVGDRR